MITHLQRKLIPLDGPPEFIQRIPTVGSLLPINLSDEFNLETNPAVKVTVEREDGTLVEWTACGWSMSFETTMFPPDGEEPVRGRVVCDFYLDEDGQPKVEQFWREEA